MRAQSRTLNTVLRALGLIGLVCYRNNRASFFDDAIRTRERVSAHAVQHKIDILRNIFEFCRRIIDRLIDANVFKRRLMLSRCSGDHFCAASFPNLNRETSDAARTTVNQNGLALCHFRGVDQRLPRRGRRERNSRGFFETDVLRLERSLGFLGHRELGITAAAHHRQITVDRIALFEFLRVSASFLNHARDIVTDDGRAIVESAFGEHSLAHIAVHRIHTGSHHPNENLVILRFRFRRVLILQNFRPAPFVHDDRLHHRRIRFGEGETQRAIDCNQHCREKKFPVHKIENHLKLK